MRQFSIFVSMMKEGLSKNVQPENENEKQNQSATHVPMNKNNCAR